MSAAGKSSTWPRVSPDEPPLDGERLTCGLLMLGGSTVIGHTENGAVFLLAARVTALFDCTGIVVCNDSGPALDANTLHVGQNMRLIGEFAGSGGDGAVCLLGARIGGHLICDGTKLCNDSGPALFAQSLQVGQHKFLARRVHCHRRR